MSDAGDFRRAVYANYRERGRSFPWRETRDPYRILVSEFMLQQTQTERVIPKYEAWLERYPTIQALAEASLKEVLALWSGLGYNRRARNLQEACRAVTILHGGVIPREARVLETLPGVGAYTAGAVSTFAYGEPNVFIETNIRSVFIHFFFSDRDQVTDRMILPLIEETLDRKDPRNWYYALMDYGALLKRTLGNPSRSSAHHVRQSTFLGSRREARGAVLRSLSARGESEAPRIAETEGIELSRIMDALEALSQEGFVVEKGGVYGIRE